MKYFSTLKDKFCILVLPCKILDAFTFVWFTDASDITITLKNKYIERISTETIILKTKYIVFHESKEQDNFPSSLSINNINIPPSQRQKSKKQKTIFFLEYSIIFANPNINFSSFPKIIFYAWHRQKIISNEIICQKKTRCKYLHSNRKS